MIRVCVSFVQKWCGERD